MNENKHSHLSKLVCTHGRTHAPSIGALDENKQPKINIKLCKRASERTRAGHNILSQINILSVGHEFVEKCFIRVGKSLSFTVVAPNQHSWLKMAIMMRLSVCEYENWAWQLETFLCLSEMAIISTPTPMMILATFIPLSFIL